MIDSTKYLGYVMALCVVPAFAAVTPIGSAFDQHVQTVIYNPDDIVNIKTRVGVATLIQFRDDDIIDDSSMVGMGDALAWKVSRKRNNILLKPTQVKPDTNFTVVTNKRTYLFRLETAKSKAAPSYIIRFVYPDAKSAAVTQEYQQTPCKEGNGYVNYSYVKWGDQDISPIAAWDDGKFACFKFSKGTELPKIFKRARDGKEALVNTHMENDTVVVHEVAKEYRFRLGDEVLGVKKERPKNIHVAANSVPNTDAAQPSLNEGVANTQAEAQGYILQPLNTPVATKNLVQAQADVKPVKAVLEQKSQAENAADIDELMLPLTEAPKNPGKAAETVAVSSPIKTLALDTPDEIISAVPAHMSLKTWAVSSSDITLRRTLAKWATRAGWQLQWDAPVDLPLTVNASFTGTFNESVKALFSSLSASDVNLQAMMYTGNRVLRITEPGQRAR